MDRRTYLATSAVVAIAGCTELGGPGETKPDDGGNQTTGGGGGGGNKSPNYPEMAGTFDDFENTDKWELVAGSASPDSRRAYKGSQSIRMTTVPGEGQARIVRELEDPIDCTKVSPGLAVASSGATAPLIQLIDDDGNRVDYRANVAPDVNMLRGNFGVTHVEGEPKMGEITEIQIAYIAGGSSDSGLWIDDLHFVPRPTTGKVMLQFDGGFETDRTRAMPLLKEYGYSATSFISPNRLREGKDVEGSRLTEDQVEKLSKSGWTIGSHTANARILTGLEDGEKEKQISEAVEWLKDNDYSPSYFSYPGGKYDQRSLELVSKYHDMGFIGRYCAQGYAATPSLWSRVTHPSAESARKILDTTAKMGGITALTYYELSDGAYGDFRSAVGYIKELENAGDIEVIMPSDAEEFIYQP